jgi:2-oxoacid:acceptor oxidoreductase gamma subunit (pyruvate/2-ketoisovalerate family)
MRQVIICGRGGQGVMECAELLALAQWNSGRSVQAFPSFQPEKRGAITAAFVRSDSREIWLRCEVGRADSMIVLDMLALSEWNPVDKLVPGGLIVANDPGKELPPAWARTFKVLTLDASKIAVSHRLGNRLVPQVNQIMLAAYTHGIDDPPFDIIESTILARESSKPAELRAAIREAYDLVVEATACP